MRDSTSRYVCRINAPFGTNGTNGFRDYYVEERVDGAGHGFRYHYLVQRRRGKVHTVTSLALLKRWRRLFYKRTAATLVVRQNKLRRVYEIVEHIEGGGPNNTPIYSDERETWTTLCVQQAQGVTCPLRIRSAQREHVKARSWATQAERRAYQKDTGRALPNIQRWALRISVAPSGVVIVARLHGSPPPAEANTIGRYRLW